MAELEESVKSKILGTNTEGKDKTGAEVEDEVSAVLSQRKRRNIEKLKGLDLENLVLEAERDNVKLRNEVKGGVNVGETDEETKQRADKEFTEKALRIEQAKALYTSCIEAGGDPKRCADMVAGLIPSPQVGMAAPPATSVTDLIHALTELDQLRGDKGGELKEVLEKLTVKVEALGNRPPADPVAMAQQQAQAISATYEALRNLGIIKEPEVTTSEGKPLEVVKEEHHHEERMEELRADREFKKDITEIASDIPERVGRGIAGQMGEEEESRGGGELESLTCQEEGCGTKIYITPDTGPQVTCPKCGTIYSRKGTVETK